MELQSPKTLLKSLKTIHWSLVAGLSLFAAVVAFELADSEETKLFDGKMVMIFVPTIMAIFIIPTALALFRRQLTILKKKKTLTEKLMGYRAAQIVKVGMLEAVGLTALVISFVTFTTINLFVFALVLILMGGSSPSSFRVSEHLGLSREEAESLGG